MSASASFTAAITAPAAGAVVAAGQDLSVTWAPQPAADYIAVSLYRMANGSWSSVYGSPWPRAADVKAETIPGSVVDAGVACCLGAAGTYLLNVAFTRSNCPPTADGCVHSAVVASEQFTVQ